MKRLAAAVLASLVLVVPAGAQEPSEPQPDICEVADDEAFAAALATLTEASVARIHEEFDYPAAVGAGWEVAEMDAVLAREAEIAGETLRRKWGPWSAYLTGWGIGAEEAADDIADRVFGSEAFAAGVESVSRFAIEQLAQAFANDRSRLVDPVQRCVSGYLDANYPAIIGASARASFAVGRLEAPIGDIDGPKSLLDFAAVVAGITLVVSGRIVRRIAARVAGGVARRVAGKILARAIPVVGWLLLAWEALFAQAGAIPSIVEAIRDDQVVTGLQAEIAGELKAGMGENLGEISDGVVADTLAYWQRFRADHRTLLGLIETEPAMRAYMDGFAADDDLTPVNLALVRVIEVGGEEALVGLVEQGRLGEAVEMSDEGYRIARDLGDIRAALDWEATAPHRLAEVLRTDLHRIRAAADLTPATLAFVLDLGGLPSIGRIAAMPPDLIETMPRYGAERVKLAARAFDAREVGRFFAALRGVDDIQARNVVWAELAVSSGAMDAFLGKVEAVAASRNQAVAADILFSGSFALLQPQRIADAVSAAWRGEVSWDVVTRRYWIIAIAAGFIGVLLFGPFFRMLLPRRRRA